MRDTLYADASLEAWPPKTAGVDVFPWNLFFMAREHIAAKNAGNAVACWRQIVASPDAEPRIILQAWHFLRLFGQNPDNENAKKVLGVVVEMGMPGGFDLLAAYSDHCARYYNYSKGGIIWEHADNSLDAPIDNLLQVASFTVQKIGVWNKPRLPAPDNGIMRFSFLTPSGLYFGQGPVGLLAKDPLGVRVYESATVLMKALIAKTK